MNWTTEKSGNAITKEQLEKTEAIDFGKEQEEWNKQACSERQGPILKKRQLNRSISWIKIALKFIYQVCISLIPNIYFR